MGYLFKKCIKMKNKTFDFFLKKHSLLETEEEKHNLLKDFMLSLSFDELMAWTQYLSDNIDAQIEKNIKEGLTEEDKEFYRQQFAKFDIVVEQIQRKKAA